MTQNIIIAMRNVLHPLSMYIVLEDSLKVHILFVSTQWDTLRPGKFWFILMVDKELALSFCHIDWYSY